MLETIPNRYPHLITEISLTYPFAHLCPISGEPQPDSTITIAYQAGSRLLETKALRQYLATFTQMNDVRDLEEAVQVIAQACANTLAVRVTVRAHYQLLSSAVDVAVTATPATGGGHYV
ncbi:hypothetical protein A6A03_04465 [Chloroflexus islandicus]|uniref:PreQ(1) synthase n=1 Tax=Chloroflexus islandicus TaxID=1707952 RepID=A0A178M0D4_9CHLR|nr:hypothetical protein [Chloroflexus islandicus]OAN40568.1 hypothetical protein A6A03_04465 [Chloroflexus islandicus]